MQKYLICEVYLNALWSLMEQTGLGYLVKVLEFDGTKVDLSNVARARICNVSLIESSNNFFYMEEKVITN